jgi:tetratricopeptide (TPR) repeat protein
MATTEAQKAHKQGVDLFRKGKYKAALKKFTEALSGFAGSTRRMAEVYNDLGVTHKQLEEYEAAHQALDEAMARFRELEDKKGQAQTIGNRAAVYEAQGLIEQAVEHYKESAGMLEEVGESEMAMYAWQAVSRLRMKQGQYIAAIGAYEEGVENMPQGSFKRKVIEKILKVPGGMLGAAGKSTSDEE